MVRTCTAFHFWAVGSTPGLGTKIPHKPSKVVKKKKKITPPPTLGATSSLSTPPLPPGPNTPHVALSYTLLWNASLHPPPHQELIYSFTFSAQFPLSD